MFGLPRLQVSELFRETLGVGRRRKGFLAYNRGRLMLPMPVARRAREPQHDDVGSELADDPNRVRENLFATPLGQGLLSGLRKTEVDGAGEELLGAVDAAGGEEFLGS